MANVTWKWTSESTPIRSTNKTSKFRTSTPGNSTPQNKHSYRSNVKKSSSSTSDSATNGTNVTSGMSPNILNEPETHSPKGLYKFQEEMRKIQFETESETSCDNISDVNMSITTDTGYPNQKQQQEQPIEQNYNGDVSMSSTPKVPKTDHFLLNDSLKMDLLNDSDFDQVLLTCTENAEKKLIEKQQLLSQPLSRTPVKKVNSDPEIKTSSTISTASTASIASSSSEWNLINDESIDDLLSNIDVDIPMNEALNNSKFQRHRSMPQSQANAAKTGNFSAVTIKQQPKQEENRIQSNAIRKSFTRHESMPTTNVVSSSHLRKPPQHGKLKLIFILHYYIKRLTKVNNKLTFGF